MRFPVQIFEIRPSFRENRSTIRCFCHSSWIILLMFPSAWKAENTLRRQDEGTLAARCVWMCRESGQWFMLITESRRGLCFLGTYSIIIPRCVKHYICNIAHCLIHNSCTTLLLSWVVAMGVQSAPFLLRTLSPKHVFLNLIVFRFQLKHWTNLHFNVM